MPHLGRFRKGWENEHLASFLLSRVSFVANPMTVADDIGSDFFCTLFEVAEEDKLFPRSSFAIQIKSSKDEIDATGKIEYLEKLELPFFIGVIDQANLRLSIYSGEYLPIFFSHYGIPLGLKLSLDDASVTFDNYCEVRPEGRYILRMPHLLDFDAAESSESIVGKGKQLLRLCSRMHQNISSRVSCEYLFKLGDDRSAIFAGCGSAVTFRDNFYYRLAEVFRNLEWLHRGNPQQFKIGELEIYKRCYLDLKKARPVPIELTAAHQDLKQRLKTPS